jgi:lipopolysaccharide transport system ATP-binding protein
MSDIVIRVENLGKRYRIGERVAYKTLRETIMKGFAAPMRGIRAARSERSSLTGVHPPPDHIWALRDVSFEITRGEVVGIMGANGSGKSTLLKILSRVVKPTVGRTEVHGHLGALLEVGTGFHPELTGRENIYFNGVVLGMKRAEIDAKFDEIVDFSGIETFLDTPVKHYSSGMHVRLAFAVAAQLEPDVMIIDEVLAVGDAAFQKKCITKMKDAMKDGRTVLFVSHSPQSLRDLCTRGILLEHGRMQIDGPIDTVLARWESGAGVTPSMVDPAVQVGA